MISAATVYAMVTYPRVRAAHVVAKSFHDELSRILCLVRCAMITDARPNKGPTAIVAFMRNGVIQVSLIEVIIATRIGLKTGRARIPQIDRTNAAVAAVCMVFATFMKSPAPDTPRLAAGRKAHLYGGV